MDFIIIERNYRGAYVINNKQYYYYSKRDAIALYKQENGLKYKRNVVILDNTK